MSKKKKVSKKISKTKSKKKSNAKKLPRNEEEIKHPHYYNTGKIEVWDFIVDQGLDFLEGNVVKYVSRWKHKHTKKLRLKDLYKTRAYLEKLIAVAENPDHRGDSI